MYFSPLNGPVSTQGPLIASVIPGQVKSGLSTARKTYLPYALAVSDLFKVAAPGADLVTTTVESTFVLPARCKISKIGVGFTAIDSLAGTNLFNIVVGPGAYVVGSTATNDNSSTSGVTTNLAVPGNALFNVDVPITVANFPGATVGTGGTSGLGLIPTYPDAVYPSGTLLTLRLTTTAATGSITQLTVTGVLEIQLLDAGFPTQDVFPAPIVPFPGTDF